MLILGQGAPDIENNSSQSIEEIPTSITRSFHVPGIKIKKLLYCTYLDYYR